jgi:NitT/TauT family transport system substrate-binding protein
VLATRGDYLRGNRDVVERMVRAVREGWQSYLVEPPAGNALMRSLNKTMDEQTFAESAAAQETLISTHETVQKGLGVMTRERWEALVRQLAELKVIDKAPPVEECFVDLSIEPPAP